MPIHAVRRSVSLRAVLGPIALAAPASAQCVDWTPGYHVAGIDGVVHALAVFDDGGGPELYAGGQFQAAGDVLAANVAKWDGARWSPVGAGRPSPVLSFCVWDDGTGAALYTGLQHAQGYVPPSGALTAIAKWDGATWTGLPGGIDLGFGNVQSLVVHDDGTGDALYVGGYFHYNSPVWPQVPSIARFDGSTWSPVGNGFVNMSNVGIPALISHDAGNGPRLWAGGQALRTVSGPVYGPVAVFDGAHWQLAGAGFSQIFGEVRAFAKLGTGPFDLCAGGQYALGTTSNSLMRFTGAGWTPLGGQIVGEIDHLLAVSTPGLEGLYATGGLWSAGSAIARGIARWNGAAWQSLPGTTPSTMGPIAEYVESGVARLCVGGDVLLPGGPDAAGIARFDGSGWSALGDGVDERPLAYRMATFDDGQGPMLLATSDKGVLRRAGDDWVPFDPVLVQPVTALQVHDDGAHGPRLYASLAATVINGRNVAQVVRWDGAGWTALGTGLSFANPGWYPRIHDMASFASGSGPLLVVGGDFDQADGQVAPFAAAWDGQAWIQLSTGLNHLVRDVEVFDDGSGPALFVCGQFSVPGGSAGIARWNGSIWTSGGPGARPANLLHAHDSGAGPRLYASRATVPTGIDFFDGVAWTPLLDGVQPVAFASYDDGAGGGADLYASGGFVSIGGASARGIARFDGAQWSALGEGIRFGIASHLHVFDDGRGAALFAQGDFDAAGAHPVARLARYGPTGTPGCVATTGVVVCAGDGGGAACPCGNTGSADRGCGNSANASGATLVAEGQAHLASDRVTLRASGMTFGGAALFFQGTQTVAGGSGVAFGDGVRCASGAQIRLAIRAVSGGSASFGAANPGDLRVSASGQLTVPGARHYQVWYRDAQSFCTPSTFNLSNALRISWAP